MNTDLFTPKISVAELVTQWPQTIPVFLRHKMSCIGCDMSTFESLSDAAKIYQIPLEQLVDDLSTAIQAGQAQSEPAPSPAAAVSIPQTPIKELFMTTPYTFFTEIAETIDTIPTESIVSRTIYRDDHLKAIVFAFAPGQELSEHTASVPAVIQILDGECELTLGTDSYTVKAGAWARMPANLPHSIVAKTPVKMLLMMLP